MCLCPKEELHNLSTFFPFRSMKEMRHVYEEASSANQRRTKAQGKAILAAWSLRGHQVFILIF